MLKNSEVEYRKTIRELSDRIVEAQRPIRILDAIKWDASVQEAFFEGRFAHQPPVDLAYYQERPLSFNPQDKLNQFYDIERDLIRLLGQYNPIGEMMRRICREYRAVVQMLEARGTDTFTRISQQLYGSSFDVFHADDPNIAEMGSIMASALEKIDRSSLVNQEKKDITAEKAVEILHERLKLVFTEPEDNIRVIISDGIVADAAAGADYLKLRKEAMFSERDLRVLEIHEGWVHVGTTINGSLQPVCTFLSKGPPSSTVTQEGLAILMEVITFSSHPLRLKKLTNRIRCVQLAEQGATFLDVFRFLLGQGFSEHESYNNAARVFRGSTPFGGPFTKDLAYNKGFIMVYNLIQLAVKKGMLDRIPLLFVGKTTIEDLRTLSHLVEEGIVIPPKYLPPQIADLNALAAWMCYSNFLNNLSLDRIEGDYDHIL